MCIPQPGRHGILGDESLNFLVMMIEAVPTVTLKELNDTLQATWPGKQPVSDSTVARALDGALITQEM